MNNYENITFGEDGWMGTTFGCSCCSYTESFSNSVEEIQNTLNMYKSQVKRYEKMLEFAKNENLELLYSIWLEYKSAHENLEAAIQWEKDPKSCGTWQKSMYDIGFEVLNKRVFEANNLIKNYPNIQEIAKVFYW